VDVGEDHETVRAFAQSQRLTFPILLDENGSVARKYGVQGIPTSFFIDRQGVIQARYTGALNESLINEYLGQTE
jgi:peroxiredoxin